MQRMIRQFAAEYTSKNSSTQDSSQPNSTKNQSLPKSPSRQSSPPPPPATTQNPVLSKLLMADQDSPLDLTVKKPQSEEPCEQADGVLDLSTKKSPCSGSTHSSISPSTSNAIGNGTQKSEGKGVNPCNSTSLTLEKFMVKLCAHHQKQFILVLNSLCTEEPFVNPISQSASILDVKNANIEDNSHCVSDRCTREPSIHSTSTENSISTAMVCKDMDYPREEEQNIDLLKSPVSLGVEENSEITFLNNCSHFISHQQENISKNHIVHVKPTEENSQLLQSNETGCTKNIDPLQTDISECCVLSHSNLTLSPVTNAQEAEFLINLPKCADKENARCISPRQINLDKDSDCKLKQNSVNTVVVTKLGNNLNHYESFQNHSDNSVPALYKIRTHENIKHSKTAKRCKNTTSFRKSDCDNQCDVVYVSEPIAAQYHFPHQKSLLYSRNTARKSTRGYLFNDECCQLSTVRTLVRNSKVEDKGNCALHFAKALIIPDRVITETLPLTDNVSWVHSEETCVGIGTVNPLAQNAIIPESSICKESGNTDEISSMVEQSVNAVSDSLLAVFSVVHDGNINPSFSGPHPANEILQKKSVDMMEQGNIPLDVSNLNAHHPEKHPSEVSYSSVSVNEGKNAALTSLDVDLIVSLKDETMVSENNTEEIAAIEIFSQKPAVEQIHVPLENTSISPSISCSELPLLNEIENDRMVPTSTNCVPCQRNSKTLDRSILTFEELEFLPAHSKSETLANGTKEKTFEDSSYFSQKTEYVHNDYIEPYSDKRFVHVEPTEKLELNNVETVEPSEVINCSTAGNHVARISTEDVHRLLDTCAKISEPSDLQLKDRSVTRQAVQQCHSVTSFEHGNNGGIEKSSQTKEINGETYTNVVKQGTLHNLLAIRNTDGKIYIPSKRKLKKTTIPSDRCLRSREAQTNSCRKKNASLHIQISQFSSTNSYHRSVTFSNEYATATQYGLLTQIHTNFEESLDGKNCFVQFLSNQFAEEKTLLSERMFKNTICSTPKRVENVSINFEISSEQRKVYFCSKIENCCKADDMESSCSPGVFKNDQSFKFKKSSKQVPVVASVSLARTRSKTKHVALNQETEHEEKLNKAKIMQYLSAKNEKQSSKCRKSQAFTNMDLSSHSSKEKEMARPKFLDWCFEEESQERISNFNNKYSSVHNNWISLEKDVSVGSKSKNKADKLKEIWKTKKRVRKAKTIEAPQRYSPMQMLFMNSFKLSDICRWFLETTETKSLVIVKKLNSRLPEEHQLPVLPSQKHSRASLYPHTLQAERLKKHLKKFASQYPAPNDAKTQNALIKLDNKVQLFETSETTVKEASDSIYSGSKAHANKPTSARILRKYNHFREKLHHPSSPLNKKRKESMEQNSAEKMDLVQNIRQFTSSKLNSQTSADPPVCKLVIADKKQKARKRPKDDQLIKPGVQTSKRRKIEIKQELDKNRHIIIKNALPTNKTKRKVERTDMISKFQAPKRQATKAQVSKAATLKKGKIKTAMQKKSSKTQLVVQKCQTRSSKLRPVSPVMSEQRITRATRPWMKEFSRKLCTGSKTANKNSDS
ncbi:ligand-dependent corepressor isoform 2-T2 [Mantella aurantiaca]